MDQVKQTITVHGHAVVGINANTKSRPPTPGFAYTVGLEATYGQPELIVFGLPYEVAHGLLNDLAARMKDEGLSLSDGDIDDKTLRGHRVAFREVRTALIPKHLRIAHVIADRVRALQLVWPDPFGKFPWEEGFDERYALTQPSLYSIRH